MAKIAKKVALVQLTMTADDASYLGAALEKALANETNPKYLKRFEKLWDLVNGPEE